MAVESIGLSETGSLAFLEFVCSAANVPFDRTRAAEAIRLAIRDVPPTIARAARTRMSQAAARLGIALISRQLSIREALGVVAQEAPLVIFTVTPDGRARWFALAEAQGRRLGRFAPLDHGDTDEWHSLAELAHILGTNDPDSVLEWYLVQQAKPMIEATSPYTDVGDHLEYLEPHTPHGHIRPTPPLTRLLGLLRPERSDLWIVFFFAIGIGIFTLATPVAATAVVNSIALATVRQQLIVLCLALFVALSVAGVLQYFQTLVVEFIQRRLFVRVTEDLAYRLPRVELRAFDRQHGPELVNRFFDVLTVQKAAATLLLDGLTIGLQILIGMILLGYYHTVLIGFDLILLAALAILFVVLGRGATRTAIQESIAKFRVAGWLQELAQHPIAFKTAGGPRFALERADLLANEYLTTRAAHYRLLLRQLAFALFLQAVANVTLLGVGGYLVIQGDLTLGELVAAEIVLTLVVATFTKLFKQLEAYYDMLAAVDKLGHLIDLPLEREGGTTHIARSGGAHVRMHHVTFSYTGSHHNALPGISIELKPGERVALMGPNGSGKSTLVDLLYGLRSPDEGWIEVDGSDLRDLQLDSYREHVALVDRLEIFEGSILTNIRMGRQDLTIADIREALRKVGLLNTVMDLPDGMQTWLWPGGAPLSLGQANRLMLARAMVGQPRLLILDETLDHMDADIRETVLPALLGQNAHWTLVVVTHSQEIGRLCDRVIRLERVRNLTLEHA